MAWPTGPWNADGGAARAWAAVANAVSTFEPVTMIVSTGATDTPRQFLNDAVTILELPLDDAWMRDIGPTFVRSDDGAIAGVDWVFNGWGQQSWASWGSDALIAKAVCVQAGVGIVHSAMVNEGGGINVDGNGTVLLTKTVQLGEGRNPSWSKTKVEAELVRTIGATRCIWIEAGLTRDYEEFGTRGHIDIVATFVPSGAVLVHDQQDPEHPDFAISAAVKAVMHAAGLEVIALPAPSVLRDNHGFVDYSYVNHYVCNGAVIQGTFDDPGDVLAGEILQRCYPDRTIVPIDAREIFTRGGGIHCITQQQPAQNIA